MESYPGNSRAYLQGLPVESSPSSSSFGGLVPPTTSSMYPESASPRVPPNHGPSPHHLQSHSNYSAELYPSAHSTRQYEPIPHSRASNYYYAGQDPMHSLSSVPKHSRPPDIKIENKGIPRSLEVTRVGPAHMFSSIAPSVSTQIIVSRPNMAHSVMSSVAHHRTDTRLASDHSLHRPSHSKASSSVNHIPGRHSASTKSYPSYLPSTSSKGVASHNPPMLIKAEEPTTLSAASSSNSRPSSRHRDIANQFETATAPIPYALAKQADDPHFYDRLENSFAPIKRVENPWALKARQEPTLPVGQKLKPEDPISQRQRKEIYHPSTFNSREKVPLVNGIRDSQLSVRASQVKIENREPDYESKYDSALDLSVKTIRQTADSTAPEPSPSPINYSDPHAKSLVTGASLGKTITHEMQLPSHFYKDKSSPANTPSSSYYNLSNESVKSLPSPSKGEFHTSTPRVPHSSHPPHGHSVPGFPYDNSLTSPRVHPSNAVKRTSDPYYGNSAKMQKVGGGSNKRRSIYPTSQPNAEMYSAPPTNIDPARGSHHIESPHRDPYLHWASPYEKHKLAQSKEFYITKHENPYLTIDQGPEKKPSEILNKQASSSHARYKDNISASSYYSSYIPQTSSHYQTSSKSSPSYLVASSEHSKSYPVNYYAYAPKQDSPHTTSQGLGDSGPKESHRSDADTSHYLNPSVSVSLVSESAKYGKNGTQKSSLHDPAPPSQYPYPVPGKEQPTRPYNTYQNSDSYGSRYADQRSAFEEFSEGINKKFDVVDKQYFRYPEGSETTQRSSSTEYPAFTKSTAAYSPDLQPTTQARNPFEDYHDKLYYSKSSTPLPTPIVPYATNPERVLREQQNVAKSRNCQLIKARSPELFHCDEMPSLIKVTEIDRKTDPECDPHNSLQEEKTSPGSAIHHQTAKKEIKSHDAMPLSYVSPSEIIKDDKNKIDEIITEAQTPPRNENSLPKHYQPEEEDRDKPTEIIKREDSISVAKIPSGSQDVEETSSKVEVTSQNSPAHPASQSIENIKESLDKYCESSCSTLDILSENISLKDEENKNNSLPVSQKSDEHDKRENQLIQAEKNSISISNSCPSIEQEKSDNADAVKLAEEKEIESSNQVSSENNSSLNQGKSAPICKMENDKLQEQISPKNTDKSAVLTSDLTEHDKDSLPKKDSANSSECDATKNSEMPATIDSENSKKYPENGKMDTNSPKNESSSSDKSDKADTKEVLHEEEIKVPLRLDDEEKVPADKVENIPADPSICSNKESDDVHSKSANKLPLSEIKEKEESVEKDMKEHPLATKDDESSAIEGESMNSSPLSAKSDHDETTSNSLHGNLNSSSNSLKESTQNSESKTNENHSAQIERKCLALSEKEVAQKDGLPLQHQSERDDKVMSSEDAKQTRKEDKITHEKIDLAGIVSPIGTSDMHATPKDLSIHQSNLESHNASFSDDKALSLVCKSESKPEVPRLTLRTDLLAPTAQSEETMDLSADKSISAAFQEASKGVSSPMVSKSANLYPNNSLLEQSPWKSKMPFSIPPDYCPPSAHSKVPHKREPFMGNAHKPNPSLPPKYSHPPSLPPQSPYGSRPASSHSVPPHSSPSLMPPPSHSAPPQEFIPPKNSATTLTPQSPFQPRNEPNPDSIHSNSSHAKVSNHGNSLPPKFASTHSHHLHPSIVKPDSQSSSLASHSSSKVPVTSSFAVTTTSSLGFSYSNLYSHYATHSDPTSRYPTETPLKHGTHSLTSHSSSSNHPSDSYQAVRSPHSPLHPPPVDDYYGYKNQVHYPRSPSYPPSSNNVQAPHVGATYSSSETKLNQIPQGSYIKGNTQQSNQDASTADKGILSSSKAPPQGYKEYAAPFSHEGSSKQPFYQTGTQHSLAESSTTSQHAQNYQSNYLQQTSPNHSADLYNRVVQKKVYPKVNNNQYRTPSPAVSYAGPYATSEHAKYSNVTDESQSHGRPPSQPGQKHSYQNLPHVSPSYAHQQGSSLTHNYPPLAHSQKKNSSSSTFPGHPPKAAHSQTYSSSQVCQAPPPSYPRSSSTTGSLSGNNYSQYQRDPLRKGHPELPYAHAQINSESSRHAQFSQNQNYYYSQSSIPSRSSNVSPLVSRSKTPQSLHSSPSPSQIASPHPNQRVQTPSFEAHPPVSKSHEIPLAHQAHYNSKLSQNPPLNLINEGRDVQAPTNNFKQPAERKGSQPYPPQNYQYSSSNSQKGMPGSNHPSQVSPVHSSAQYVPQSSNYLQPTQAHSVSKASPQFYSSSQCPTTTVYSHPKDSPYPPYSHQPYSSTYSSSSIPYSTSSSTYNDYASQSYPHSVGYPEESPSSSNKKLQMHSQPYQPNSSRLSHPFSQNHSAVAISSSSTYSSQSYPNSVYSQSPKTFPPPKQAHAGSVYRSSTQNYASITTTTTTTVSPTSVNQSYPTNTYPSSHSFSQAPYSYSQSYPGNASYSSTQSYSGSHSHVAPTMSSSYGANSQSYSYTNPNSANTSYYNSQPYLPPKPYSESSVPYRQDVPALDKTHPSTKPQLPSTYHQGKSHYSIPPDNGYYSDNQIPQSNNLKYPDSFGTHAMHSGQHREQMSTHFHGSHLSSSSNVPTYGSPYPYSSGSSAETLHQPPHVRNHGVEDKKAKDIRGSSRPLPFPSKHPSLLNRAHLDSKHSEHSPLKGDAVAQKGIVGMSQNYEATKSKTESDSSLKKANQDQYLSKKDSKEEGVKQPVPEEHASKTKNDFDCKFDNFLQDLSTHSESLTSRKSCYLGMRYAQKLQLQKAVDNNEVVLPDPVIEEESEESEHETPVKFRGKFKSIKDKAKERLILTYVSHSDESATEMIPDEDASDFEEELIKEIKAKSRKGKKGKLKLKESPVTNHSKCPLKTQRLKTLIKEEKGKRIESDFTLSTSDSDSSSGYSMTRSSSESSGSGSESDDSIASNSDSSSEAKTAHHRKKISKRKIHSDSSYSDQSFSPKKNKMSIQASNNIRRAKRKGRRLSSDSDDAKEHTRKKLKKKLKNNLVSPNKRKLVEDESESDVPKTRSTKKLSRNKFSKSKTISSSESEDLPVEKKIKLPKPLIFDSSDEATSKTKKTKQSKEQIKSEFEDKIEEIKFVDAEDEQSIDVDYNSLVDDDDTLLLKIRKQREDECRREDVLEMTAWRDEVSKEMLKMLSNLPEAHWRQSWKKPQFGEDFHKGWQQELKQFKVDSIRTPKNLVFIPPVPASNSSNEKSSKKVSKDSKQSPSKSSRSPSPAKNTRSKSGIVKTSLDVAIMPNCKVASRPEISSVMQRFFEKVMGSSGLQEAKNSLVKKLPPNPFSLYGPPRVPTGLTPTPSVAPSMMASDDSDRDSLASLRTDFPASDSVPVARKHSIANALIKKLKKKYSESKVNTQWLNKPRSILQSTNKPQLLPTPGLTIKNASSSDSLKLSFRQDSVNKYRDTFDEIIAKNDVNEFTPILAPSRTRTKSKAIMDAATIKSVFGDDAPVKEEVQIKSTKAKKTPPIKLEEVVVPAPSPIPSSVSHSSTPVDFLFQNTEEGYDSELRSERSSSVMGESSLLHGIRHTRKKFRKNKKGSSGFDYIRPKKKKVRPDEDVMSTAKRKVPARKRVLWPSAMEVATEVRTWVTNKGLGETILHKAARLRYHDVVVHCLESGDYDVNVRDNAGYTPLHEACNRGHLDIAQALCAHGAFLNAPGYGGKRPLHEAIENGFPELARLLLTYGADPSLSTYAGQSCLSLANESTCKDFLENYLCDLRSEKAQVCLIPGPANFFDLQDEFSDFFSRLKKSTEEEPSAPLEPVEETRETEEKPIDLGDLAFESCTRPLPMTYWVKDKPGRYMLQADLLEFMNMTLKELVIAAGSIQTVCLGYDEFPRLVQSSLFGYNDSPVIPLTSKESDTTLVMVSDHLQKLLDVDVVMI